MPEYYREGTYAPGYTDPDPNRERLASVADPYGSYYFALELTIRARARSRSPTLWSAVG